LASTYGQRPSSIVGIKDDWAAYQFDLAVLEAGLSEMAGGNGRGSRQEPAPARNINSRGFADPSARVAHKMKIPESGVW
jgi:hypothetical protein